MERAVVLTSLFVPILMGLLARTTESERARRRLTAWLPFAPVSPLALYVLAWYRIDSLLACAAATFWCGITAGLSLHAARSIYGKQTARH